LEENSFETETIQLGTEEEGNLREVEIQKCTMFANRYSFEVFY